MNGSQPGWWDGFEDFAEFASGLLQCTWVVMVLLSDDFVNGPNWKEAGDHKIAEVFNLSEAGSDPVFVIDAVIIVQE